jgi:Ca2+-binding EF-hand superfamily protein
MGGNGNNTAMLGSGEGKFSNEEQRITADEAFDRIDTDRSGGLDSNELASALKLAAVIGSGSNSTGYIGIRSKEILSEMASRLLRLYDKNSDGVVDREEYRIMVRDMAVLRETRLLRDEEGEGLLSEGSESAGIDAKRRGWFTSFFAREEESNATMVVDENNLASRDSDISGDVMDVTENEVFWSLVDQGEGSIVLET